MESASNLQLVDVRSAYDLWLPGWYGKCIYFLIGRCERCIQSYVDWLMVFITKFTLYIIIVVLTSIHRLKTIATLTKKKTSSTGKTGLSSIFFNQVQCFFWLFIFDTYYLPLQDDFFKCLFSIYFSFDMFFSSCSSFVSSCSCSSSLLVLPSSFLFFFFLLLLSSLFFLFFFFYLFSFLFLFYN